MEAWNEHEVTFQATESLDKSETQVRVLDQTEDVAAQLTNQAIRMGERGADADTIRQFQKGLELETNIREDPGYKFLMMVSAFSARRMGKLVSSTGNGNRDDGIDNIMAVVVPSPDKHWMQEPEISGVIYLAPTIYGHIKEAQTILNSSVSLKGLIEDQRCNTLFARLVALRMMLSSSMTNQLGFSANYKRFMQQQTMVLKALRGLVPVQSMDWTRPYR